MANKVMYTIPAMVSPGSSPSPNWSIYCDGVSLIVQVDLSTALAAIAYSNKTPVEFGVPAGSLAWDGVPVTSGFTFGKSILTITFPTAPSEGTHTLNMQVGL